MVSESTQSTQRELQRALETALIPWARAGELRLVLAQPPVQTSGGTHVTALDVPLLSPIQCHRSSRGVVYWPDEGLRTSLYPILGCVLEGEADIRIGVTESMVGNRPESDCKGGVLVLSLPRQSCFLIPPGVPYTDGSRLHWERPAPETAHCRILWMRVMPVGATIYTCFTQGLAHTHKSSVLIKDTRFFDFIKFLISNQPELCRHDPEQGNEIINSHLLVLLLLLQRVCSLTRAQVMVETPQGQMARVEGEEHDESRIIVDTRTADVERACRYIQSHLSDELSLPIIARQAYISVPQLKRLFRSELNSTVMNYITKCRIEEAKSMLIETELTVQEIGEMLGYSHRTHFSRLFNRWVGLSPAAFRRKWQSTSNDQANPEKSA